VNPSRSELPPEGLAQKNYFALFGLPVAFGIDAAALDAGWKRMQRTVHPDRFARADDAQKRLALQWSTLINEAYAVLKDPLRRAEYLCGLAGVPVDAQSNTRMPADFLELQMRLREELSELQELPQSAVREAALSALRVQCSQQMSQGLDRLQALLDRDRRLGLTRGLNSTQTAHETPDADLCRLAAEQIRALMFVKKLQAEIA
jgi:molecular chaperone HscB